MTAGSVARWLAPIDSVRMRWPGWAISALLAAGVAAAITLAASPAHAELVAPVRALIVGVPVAVGLYAWEHRVSERFGLLLVAVGGVGLISTLGESSDPTLYAIGRTAGWLLEALLVYVVLSYPSGRLISSKDRVIAAVMAVTVALLYVPRLLLDENFDVPSPFTSCVSACPPNSTFLLGQEPGFVDSVMRPAGALLVFAVGIAVLWRLWDRRRQATPLARQMFTLVLVVGAARELAVGVGITARLADSTGWTLEIAAWCIALAVPALALAFLLGIFRWRLFASTALQRLADCMRSAPDALARRRGRADAFGDPSIELALPVGGSRHRWVSPSGAAVRLPTDDARSAISEVRDQGAVVAAIVHDPALLTTPGLLDAGLAMAAVALENQRLTAEARAATREVERSRTRLAAAADSERRRIERDLHDGAQQRLVALRIELALAEDLIRRDLERGIDRLHELESEVDEALDELRSLAHGIYPPLLVDAGLGEALTAAAARCPVPARVEIRDVGRYPPEVEGAVYFSVLEALQNVAKHAHGAQRVRVHVEGRSDGGLWFAVTDDGQGMAESRPRGAGLTNLHDRLAAIDGTLSVTSPAGHGVTVRGDVPGTHRDG